MKQLKLMNAKLGSLQKELRELKGLVDPILPKTDKILSLKEAVAFLKMSDRKVRQLVYDGIIPYKREGSRLFFSQNSLIAWLNR